MTTPHQSGARSWVNGFLKIYGFAGKRSLLSPSPTPYPLLSTFCSRPLFSRGLNAKKKTPLRSPNFVGLVRKRLLRRLVCWRCVYGILQLWQDSPYVSTHSSIHHVYCAKQEVYWEVRWRREGGAVASWLVCSSPDRAVRVRALAGAIVLCSWARHLTLTAPLSTQVFKWVPANLMLGVTLRWTGIPSRGE